MTETRDQRVYAIVYSNDSRTELGERIVALEDENAKLRELTDELWALAYGYAPYESELDAARDMMRELGIEVGE